LSRLAVSGRKFGARNLTGTQNWNLTTPGGWWNPIGGP